jgi:hypothetical protein
MTAFDDGDFPERYPEEDCCICRHSRILWLRSGLSSSYEGPLLVNEI